MELMTGPGELSGALPATTITKGPFAWPAPGRRAPFPRPYDIFALRHCHSCVVSRCLATW